MKIKKRHLKLSFLVIASLLLASVIAETGLRLYFLYSKQNINSYRPTYFLEPRLEADKLRFKSHPFLPFFSKPNDSRKISIYKPAIKDTITYDYRNNSLGFRTPERPYDKPANTKRIVILGGSTTWEGPTNDTTWPAILERKLNEYYKEKGTKTEVINLAIDAGISEMSLNILNMYGIHYNPDLVISYDGVNDVWFSIYTSGILPDFSNYVAPFNDKVVSLQYILPRKLLNSYVISILSSLIDKSLKLESYLPDQIWKYTGTFSNQTFSTGMPLYIRNIRLMKAACEEFGCKFVASIPHWITPHEGVIKFDSETRQAFNQKNINYLDLQNILPHDDRSLHTDEFHWTDKGREAISDEWLKKITRDNLLGLDESTSSEKPGKKLLPI